MRCRVFSHSHGVICTGGHRTQYGFLHPCPQLHTHSASPVELPPTSGFLKRCTFPDREMTHLLASAGST